MALNITVKKKRGEIAINDAGEALIYIQYVDQNSRVALFSTGEHIEPKYLKVNSVNGRDRIDNKTPIKKSHPDHKNVNERILGKYIAVSTAINSGSSDTKSVKERYQSLDLEKGQKDSEKEPTLLELMDQFIKVSEANPDKVSRTVEQYRRNKSLFEGFFDHRKKPVTSIQDFTLAIYEELCVYMHEELEYSSNTVWNKVKNLKVFLHWLQRHGHELKVNISDMKVKYKSGKAIYLSQEEMNRIYEYKPSSERLERVKNLFIVSCTTGLRISDLSRLAPHHIVEDDDGDLVIELEAFKNQKAVYVPLTKKPLEILKNYNLQLPKISEQNFNLYIKEVCKEAGICDPVENTIKKGGKKHHVVKYKYELISTHIGVKTFITHCLEKGLSIKAVAEMTGKTEAVILEHYHGTTRQRIKKEMKNAFK